MGSTAGRSSLFLSTPVDLSITCFGAEQRCGPTSYMKAVQEGLCMARFWVGSWSWRIFSRNTATCNPQTGASNFLQENELSIGLCNRDRKQANIHYVIWQFCSFCVFVTCLDLRDTHWRKQRFLWFSCSARRQVTSYRKVLGSLSWNEGSGGV